MGKLVKFPQFARIAAKAADQAVQDKRFILGTYKNTRQAYNSSKIFKPGSAPSKETFLNMIGSRRSAQDPITAGFAAKMTLHLKNGAKGLKRELKNRARAGKALAQAEAKKPAGINRAVNAHGKGIVFRRVGGRIVPMRKK